MKQPFIDIAIIFKDIDTPFLLETIKQSLMIDYENYIVSLYPDYPVALQTESRRVRIIATGEASIPAKRNVALKNLGASSDFIAFIDADASPDRFLLKNAIRYFDTPDIVAVGGPNITPLNEQMSRKISGYVMQQKIGFGSGAIRHKICSSRYVNELPTCNLMIRAAYARKNFFDESHMIGEDTKYCNDIVTNGFKIFYAADVIVYHHRRKAGFPLFRQFYNYGYYKCRSLLNGSVFSKQFVIPSLFFLYVCLTVILSFFPGFFRLLLMIPLGIYFSIGFISSLRETGNLILSFCSAMALFGCHISYGFGFLKYFLSTCCKPLAAILYKSRKSS